MRSGRHPIASSPHGRWSIAVRSRARSAHCLGWSPARHARAGLPPHPAPSRPPGRACPTGRVQSATSPMQARPDAGAAAGGSHPSAAAFSFSPAPATRQRRAGGLPSLEGATDKPRGAAGQSARDVSPEFRVHGSAAATPGVGPAASHKRSGRCPAGRSVAAAFSPRRGATGPPRVTRVRRSPHRSARHPAWSANCLADVPRAGNWASRTWLGATTQGGALFSPVTRPLHSQRQRVRGRRLSSGLGSGSWSPGDLISTGWLNPWVALHPETFRSRLYRRRRFRTPAAGSDASSTAGMTARRTAGSPFARAAKRFRFIERRQTCFRSPRQGVACRPFKICARPCSGSPGCSQPRHSAPLRQKYRTGADSRDSFPEWSDTT